MPNARRFFGRSDQLRLGVEPPLEAVRLVVVDRKDVAVVQVLDPHEQVLALHLTLRRVRHRCGGGTGRLLPTRSLPLRLLELRPGQVLRPREVLGRLHDGRRFGLLGQPCLLTALLRLPFGLPELGQGRHRGFDDRRHGRFHLHRLRDDRRGLLHDRRHGARDGRGVAVVRETTGTGAALHGISRLAGHPGTVSETRLGRALDENVLSRGEQSWTSSVRSKLDFCSGGVDRGGDGERVEGTLTGVTASFRHYNALATYLVFVLSLALALLISRKNLWHKIVLYSIVLLLTFSLILTFSRAGWFAFIFSMILMLTLSRRIGRFIPVLIFFAVVIFAVPDLRERFVFTFQKGGDTDRLVVWRAAIEMIKDNPFLGKGIGTFMAYFHKYAPPALYVRYAHNCYLQIWAESGIFSLLAFLSFLALLLIKGIRKYLENRDYFILGLVCGIFAFLFHSFFDTQFYSLQLSVLFWVMAGVLNSMIRTETIG